MGAIQGHPLNEWHGDEAAVLRFPVPLGDAGRANAVVLAGRRGDGTWDVSGPCGDPGARPSAR